MALDEELNKILKEVWRIDEKNVKGENLLPEEMEFYNKNLPTIKSYYTDQYLYWKEK